MWFTTILRLTVGFKNNTKQVVRGPKWAHICMPKLLLCDWLIRHLRQQLNNCVAGECRSDTECAEMNYTTMKSNPNLLKNFTQAQIQGTCTLLKYFHFMYLCSPHSSAANVTLLSLHQALFAYYFNFFNFLILNVLKVELNNLYCPRVSNPNGNRVILLQMTERQWNIGMGRLICQDQCFTIHN